MKTQGAVPVLVFGLIATAVCWPALVGGESFVPSDYHVNATIFGGSRDPDLHVPLRNYRHQEILEEHFRSHLTLERALAAGELPLWDPSHLFGESYYEQPTSLLLYPPKVLLALAFEADRAFTMSMWLHLWLAGIAMYALTRRLGMAPMAAIFAGVAWMLCGKTSIYFKFPTGLAHLAWLPLVFACGVRMTWRSALAGSIPLALAMIAAGPALQLYTAVLLAAFILARGRGDLGKWAAMGGAALLMTAPVNVPMLRLMADGPRLGFGETDFSVNPRTPLVLATTVFPRILGGPVDRVNLFKAYGLPQFQDFNVYIGLAPLLALALWWKVRRETPTRFFAVAAAVFFVLLFAEPLNQFVHLIVPTPSKHFAYRMSYLFHFCAIVAAAGVFDRLSADPGRFAATRRVLIRLIAAAVGLALLGSAAAGFAGGALANWIGLEARNAHVWLPLVFAAGLVGVLALWKPGRSGPFAAAWIALTLVELFVFHKAYNPTYPSATPELPEAIRTLQARPHDRADGPMTIPWWGTNQPNLLSCYGIRTAGGSAPFAQRRTDRWARAVRASVDRWVLSTRFNDPAPLGRMGTQWFVEDGAVRPIEDAVPRAYLAANPIVVADGDAALEAVLAGRTPVIEAAAPRGTRPDAAGTVSFERDGFNEVVLRVETPAETTLILCDAWTPEWECDIDGTPTPVLRANYLLRAVNVPAGTHRVRFRFVPRLLYAMLAVAGATLLAVLGGLGWSIRRSAADRQQR